MFDLESIKAQLAPTGVLRAGINLSNFLLVSSRAGDGTPQGISPDMAGWVAAELDVACEFVTFDRPGELADAVDDGLWDIGNIAYEAERAQAIDFSNPYVVIDANFLLPEGSDFVVNTDVDQAGVKIAVSERSAYDLWLTDHIREAEILRAPSIAAAHQMFHDGLANVLASLKPKLLEEIAADTALRIIEQPFTAVKQSIGVRRGQPAAVNFLNELIARRATDGSIARSLKIHNVEEKLSIPKFS